MNDISTYIIFFENWKVKSQQTMTTITKGWNITTLNIKIQLLVNYNIFSLINEHLLNRSFITKLRKALLAWVEGEGNLFSCNISLSFLKCSTKCYWSSMAAVILYLGWCFNVHNFEILQIHLFLKNFSIGKMTKHILEELYQLLHKTHEKPTSGNCCSQNRKQKWSSDFWCVFCLVSNHNEH